VATHSSGHGNGLDRFRVRRNRIRNRLRPSRANSKTFSRRLMAKTVHTPDSPKHESITFPVCQLTEFGRGKNEGFARFVATLPKTANPFGAFGRVMDWTPPSPKEKLINLEGTLEAYQMVLTPKNPDFQKNELNMSITKVLGFQVVRRELKGKKNKGFRFDLRFEISFNQQDGCAFLENYFIRCSPAPESTMVVTYTEAPEQIEIPEVTATKDAAQKSLEIQ
jgi:hypothetical protein